MLSALSHIYRNWKHLAATTSANGSLAVAPTQNKSTSCHIRIIFCAVALLLTVTHQRQRRQQTEHTKQNVNHGVNNKEHQTSKTFSPNKDLLTRQVLRVSLNPLWSNLKRLSGMGGQSAAGGLLCNTLFGLNGISGGLIQFQASRVDICACWSK